MKKIVNFINIALLFALANAVYAYQYDQLPEVKQVNIDQSIRLIHREVYRVVPPKVEYSLTEQGESLKNTILSLEKWGKNYQQQKL
jgi:hypothetical protein